MNHRHNSIALVHIAIPFVHEQASLTTTLSQPEVEVLNHLLFPREKKLSATF